VRKAKPHPQVISTNRHILQGWVELKDVSWDCKTKTLSGTASVIGGEPFKIVVADNGAKALKAEAKGCKSKLTAHQVEGLSCLTISADDNTEIKWTLKYK